MARKKVEPIESLGNNGDKLLVQKSRPLFALWRSELTLAEFKILDTYLSRIDSHKPEKREVVFGKGELEQLLGVKRIRTEELDERLKNLMTSVKIEDSSTKRGFTRIALFEKANAEQGEDGLWQVEMMCTKSAMKYIFNVENLGYLRYKLRCITSITSRYTYIMFMYLEANRFRKSWDIDLEELKQILSCDKEETYKAFKRFNDLILKKVHKEMHEKTECKYSYEPIKKGRSVVGVRFTVETLPRASMEEIDENQLTLEDWEKATEEKRELWLDPVEELNLSPEQIEELKAVVRAVPNYKLPENSACYGNVELMRHLYLKMKMTEINRRNTEKPIKSKYGYLLKIIKQDIKEKEE